MAHDITTLDPVQGLLDYVNDIKPYHTKVIESLVEYVGQESINVTMLEEYLLNIDLDFSFDIGNLSCIDGGYGALPFDDPDKIVILSPDPTKTVTEYPAITTNSFLVLDDRRDVFDPNNNLTYKIESFIEDRIIDVTASTGLPPVGGSFTIFGDKTTEFAIDTIFLVSGSLDNDSAYKVTGVSSGGSPLTTTIEIDSVLTGSPPTWKQQIVKSDDASGFVKIFDTNNNGSFSVVSSIFTEETSKIRPYTTVFIAGISLTAPLISSIDENQRYVSLVSVGAIEYKKILSYSNALKYYDSSPENIAHTPNEGTIYAAIVDLSQGSPSYFVVDGNFENSNVFVGDEFAVVASTDNNTTYNIQSISYNASTDETTFGVASIHNSAADGFVKLDIPSNVFIVDDDYTDFFKQGVRIKVITGSKSGVYTTLYSKFVNGETQIRVLEDLITGRGRLVIGGGAASCGSPLISGIIVEGNVEGIFNQGTQFNMVSSLRNDGAYTVTDSIYCADTHSTTIAVVEPFDDTDSTGEIFEFVNGSLTYLSPGFGQTPELCEVIPETLIHVNIKDRLYIDGIGIFTSDDLIAYGIDDTWGYELPSTTIFAANEPSIAISDTAPATPTEDDLWFDTSLNSGSPTAPGILKQYDKIAVEPDVFGWVETPNNKAYWVDTDTNYMYYRIMYQYYIRSGSPIGYQTPTPANNLDTGWILEYTKIPGFNDHLTGNSTRENIGYESFFATESSTSVAETTFTLTTLSIPTVGSPPTGDPTLLEVYVNSAIAQVSVLSPTSFDIITPRLRVGDLVEARVFDNTATPSGVFIGAFDANAGITETFDLLKGYKFHINGTESVGSPAVNKIYIPDTQAGEVFDIFNPCTSYGSPPGSPPTCLTRALADTELVIISSEGSPNIDGNYTILAAEQYGSPNTHVVLTVAETLLNTGIFGGSPLIGSGKALYQQWYQYMILNTTTNTILVHGDATVDIQNGDSIIIVHSDGSPSNNGTYTVNGAPVFANGNTTITTIEALTNTGNFGGWVESI